MTVPMRRRGSAFRKRSPATGDGEGAANRRIVAIAVVRLGSDGW